MIQKLAILGLLGLTSCAQLPEPPREVAVSQNAPPLLEGLGTYRLDVTTDVTLAQEYFDQGLALCHGFHHDAAALAFVEAQRLDPNCAMAAWGEAYALGPNFNLWDEGPEYARRAHQALERARAHMAHASKIEQDLIEALSTRFAKVRPDSRAELNRAYARAMAELWREYPDHPEVGFLYADSLLCEHPWDQWNPDGTPRRDTLEIVSVLERVLELDVRHPGANHLYIHTMEASSTPERAEASADRLGALMPGVGHMVHMPAHIYMRVGRYGDSVRVNSRAAQLDREYFARTNTQQSTGIYHLYHLHNHHFLIWSAMFQGRYEDALAQCDELMEDMPRAVRSDPFYMDWFTTRYQVHLRFGRWKEVLSEPRPGTDQAYAAAMWHYARGVAQANLGDLDEARREAGLFEQRAAEVGDDLNIHVVPARDVLAVARHMLAGETAFKAGDTDRAFVELRAAVAAETALRYTEPNPWMMPTRHALGALLLQEGHLEEAEENYRADLARYPANGWALHGLAECLERQGDTAAATAARSEFEAAWREATIEIAASCFCRTR